MYKKAESLSTFVKIYFVADLERLEIAAGEQTPSVILDKEKGILKIEGFSFSDSPHIFYAPVVEWFWDYCSSPNEETLVVFSFTYVNSTSVRFINDILKKLDELVLAGKKTSVSWLISPEDEDIEQLGQELKALHKVPFTISQKEEEKPDEPKKKFLG